LDYQVNRQSTDSTQMEISGHLDVDALRQFVRVNETKATGSTTLKPLFFISAQLPTVQLEARQTGHLVKQNVLAQTLFNELGGSFQKFNAPLAAIPDTSLPLSRPPTQASDLSTLRSYGTAAGYNSVVWVHLSS